jgi:hypothetical protein
MTIVFGTQDPNLLADEAAYSFPVVDETGVILYDVASRFNHHVLITYEEDGALYEINLVDGAWDVAGKVSFMTPNIEAPGAVASRVSAVINQLDRALVSVEFSECNDPADNGVYYFNLGESLTSLQLSNGKSPSSVSEKIKTTPLKEELAVLYLKDGMVKGKSGADNFTAETTYHSDDYGADYINAYFGVNYRYQIEFIKEASASSTDWVKVGPPVCEPPPPANTVDLSGVVDKTSFTWMAYAMNTDFTHRWENPNYEFIPEDPMYPFTPNWLDGGDSSLYEAKMTLVSVSPVDHTFDAGDLLDTWLPLSINRRWASFEHGTFDLKLEVRLIGEAEILDTALFKFTVMN